ncbi:MAG: T9SS type A sorting domain-containing protein [Lentimicrobiaceae bacterium]|nr:T9SS type A sorting domain-containing protein [Lentimicrobiaceae bacterium]
MKIVFLVICFFAYNLNVVANDTIRIITRLAGGHSYSITATPGKQFTIDWGDGSAIETFTGTGDSQFPFHYYYNPGRYEVTISGSEGCLFTVFGCSRADTLDLSSCPSIIHLYCSSVFKTLRSLNVSNCKKLEVISADDNRLSILDLSDCIALKDLSCENGNLTRINLVATEFISSYENQLPLSELYKLSEMISNPALKRLGRQKFYTQRIAVGDFVDFSDHNEFGGIKTVFIVEQGGAPAPQSDYTIKDGIITFYKNGFYDVVMTNAAIISHPQNPAIVIAPIHVINFVPVQEIINIPATATVATQIYLSNATVVPNNATYQYITWSIADTGATGAFFTGSRLNTTAPGIVVVTATIKDGAAFDVPYTQDFAIEIKPLNIGEPIQELSGIKIFPNPSNGELLITFDELQVTSDELRVTIVDVSGKAVAAHHFMFLPTRQKIDISHLKSGVYFVKIATNQGEVVKKVVKQ